LRINRKPFSSFSPPKYKPAPKQVVIPRHVRRRFIPDLEDISDAIKKKTRQESIFPDIASLLAERLRQKEPSQIDCGDEGQAKNLWAQFCYLAANSDPEGYHESVVKAELENLLSELDIDDEDWEFLWLGTESGSNWQRQNPDSDNLPPVDDNKTIAHIYYGFVMDLAITEGNDCF